MLGNKKKHVSVCSYIAMHGTHNWLHDANANANDNKLAILLNLISFAQLLTKKIQDS